MEIKFQVAADKVKNFTESAKSRLVKQVEEYTIEIINEAEKTESLFRENGASPEITETSIIQAVRRNRTVKKESKKKIILRIIAESLLFISGLMFLPDYFITSDGKLNMIYFLIFIFITLSALIITIITHFMGGE